MIYDNETGKWYEIHRKRNHNLQLREIVYTKIRRFPTDKDFTFKNGILQNVELPLEPPTPQ